MKRFSEQFHTKSKTVKIQAFEREELRSRVVSYMEYHPLPQSVVATSVKSPIFNNDSYQVIRLPFSTIIKYSAAVAAVVLVVIPVLAENSVPGDTLYAVKVRFTEEVRSTLTLGSYEKVEWETERLNRRIAEARLLASEGRLTDEVEAEMADAVREHTENVQREIEELRETDADEATLASIELSTTLSMQSTSLQEEGETTLALAMTEASAENPAQMLVDVINESLLKQESNVASSSIPAYEKIMARVEMNTTRAYELLNSLGIAAEDKFVKDVNRRLEDVNRSIEKANALRGTNEEAASKHLVDALQRTQKLIVFMSDVEVNKSVDIESTVPMILTEDEERQLLEKISTEVERKIEILNTIKPQLSPAAAGKIDYALEIAESNKATIVTFTEKASAINLAKESSAVLDDSLKLAESEGVNISGVTLPTDNVEGVIEIEEATTTKEKEPKKDE